MALSLVLRNAPKIQGYSSLLRSSPIALRNVNITPFSQLTSRTSTLTQKAPTMLTSKVLSMPSVRLMSGGDHRMKWTIERVLSASLIGLLPLTVLAPNALFDNLTAVIVTLHIHWGIEAMAEDYVRPIIFGNVIPKVTIMGVYMISAITLGGLLYLNFKDIGIGKLIRKIWAIKPQSS